MKNFHTITTETEPTLFEAFCNSFVFGLATLGCLLFSTLQISYFDSMIVEGSIGQYLALGSLLIAVFCISKMKLFKGWGSTDYLIVGSLFVATGMFMIFVSNIFDPKEYTFNILNLIVCLAAVVVCILLPGTVVEKNSTSP